MSTNISKLSILPVLISVKTKNKACLCATNEYLCTSTGTGFLYRKNDMIYLITNRHVVTERSLENEILPHCSGGIPELLHFDIPVQRLNAETKEIVLEVGPLTGDIRLYSSDGKALWLVHPEHKTDVVAIPMFNIADIEQHVLCLNDMPLEDKMVISVADDVFVIGYPYGKTSGLECPLAIWKRATIASEPNSSFYPDGRDTFLIDTTTRSGMSGSPVFAKVSNVCTFENGGIVLGSGQYYKFLGVYSSRIDGDRLDDSFLGIVWKAKLIDEIIDGNVKENNPPML